MISKRHEEAGAGRESAGWVGGWMEVGTEEAVRWGCGETQRRGCHTHLDAEILK